MMRSSRRGKQGTLKRWLVEEIAAAAAAAEGADEQGKREDGEERTCDDTGAADGDAGPPVGGADGSTSRTGKREADGESADAPDCKRARVGSVVGGSGGSGGGGGSVAAALSSDSRSALRRLPLQDANLVYASHWLRKSEADDLMRSILSAVTFEAAEDSAVVVFGKRHVIPRQQAAFGDEGTFYSFSGKTVFAKRWPAALSALRERVQQASGELFNFALVNYYRDGNDCIGYHRDDEKQLGDRPTIASVSFGAERDFLFKHAGKSGGSYRILLHHGSLLLMRHPTNKNWKHSVPRRKRVSAARLNITFRMLYL